MNAAKVKISFELLASLLHFPPDTKITDVWCERMTKNAQSFFVLVEHPDLPEVSAEEHFRTVCPEIKFDWGLNSS